MPAAKEWDDRFRQGDHAGAEPDPFLVASRKYWPLIHGWKAGAAASQSGALQALDIAGGAGRHAVYLAEAGFEVTAVDFAAEGLRKARASARSRGVSIRCLQQDLEQDDTGLGESCYDLAVVFFYLHRPLLPAIRRCLRSGGLIVYKTYSVDQRRYPGRPRHPMYLLEPNELLDAFAGFRVLRYEEEWEGRGTASLVAQKR